MLKRCVFAFVVLGVSLFARGQGDDGRLCADQNGDGLVTPGDFNAWILNFNAGSPLADVNGDGLVTPADFNAWIQAFNAGAAGPTCDVLVSDASRVVAAIDFDGDVDIYRVFAETGDDLLVAVGEETTQFAVGMSLRSPSDAELDVVQSNGGFKLDLMDAPETGFYSLVVSGTPERTGVYAFTAVRIGGSLPGGQALQSGIAQAGEIVFGDIDVYRVSVPAGMAVSVTVSEMVSQFAAELRLYDPSGELIDLGALNGGVTIDAPPSPQGGTYVALVSSSGGDTHGAYSIEANVGP